MLSIFSTPELIINLWQLKTGVFLHWCLICAVPFFTHRVQVGQIFEFIELLLFLKTCLGGGLALSKKTVGPILVPHGEQSQAEK
jgi:hypothetical protein